MTASLPRNPNPVPPSAPSRRRPDDRIGSSPRRRADDRIGSSPRRRPDDRIGSSVRRRAGDWGVSGRSRRTLYLAGLLFVVAFAWSAGILDRAAVLGVRFFELYAQSQLVMLEAAGHVIDGRAEYAVLLDDTATIAALKVELEPMTTMRYERESAVPGWIVVSVQAGDRDAVSALKSAEFSRLVIPNRGLWICH